MQVKHEAMTGSFSPFPPMMQKLYNIGGRATNPLWVCPGEKALRLEKGNRKQPSTQVKGQETILSPDHKRFPHQWKGSRRKLPSPQDLLKTQGEVWLQWGRRIVSLRKPHPRDVKIQHLTKTESEPEKQRNALLKIPTRLASMKKQVNVVYC